MSWSIPRVNSHLIASAWCYLGLLQSYPPMFHRLPWSVLTKAYHASWTPIITSTLGPEPGLGCTPMALGIWEPSEVTLPSCDNFTTMHHPGHLISRPGAYPHSFQSIPIILHCSAYYIGCWEVVENQPVCIDLLVPSRYFGRTIDSVGGLFTEVKVASCKTVHSDANETWDVWFRYVCFLEGCEMQGISWSEGAESLSMSLVWPSVLEAKESSVEIMYESLEDMMRLPIVVILSIFLPVIWL